MQVNPPPPPNLGPGVPGQPTFGFPVQPGGAFQGQPGPGYPGQPGVGFPGQPGVGFPGQAPWPGAGHSAVPPIAKPRRRKGWIVAGIVVCVLGVLAVIGGAVTSGVAAVQSSLDPEGEALTPTPIRFVAEAKEYDIVLLAGRREDARDAADMECTVVLADGRDLFVDGDVQAVSTEVGNAESVGSFTAVPGDTVVTCEANGGHVTYQVQEPAALASIGLIILIVGFALGVLGAGMILLGAFWKKKPALT